MSAAAVAARTVPAPMIAGHRRRFAAIVGVAVGLHAALLAGGRPPSGPSALAPSDLRHVVTVRTIAATAERLEGPSPPSQATARPPAVERPQHAAEAVVPREAGRPHTEAVAAAPATNRSAPVARAVAAPAANAVPSRPAPDAAPPSPTAAPAPPAVDALPPAPDFLSSRSLDVPPRPLHDIDPVYPDEGQLRSGSVVLRLLIDERGDVVDAAVVRSFPKTLFDAAALGAFGPAKFSPGLRAGVAVKSQLTIEVEFTPMNRGSAVSGRSY